MTVKLIAIALADRSVSFEFSSYAEWLAKHISWVHESWDIEHVEGAEDFADLCSPNENYIEEWFEWVEQYENELNEYEQGAFGWLVGYLSYSIDQAFDYAKSVCVFSGSVEDYAYELIQNCYDLKTMGNLVNYIDYEAYAHDLEAGGEATVWGSYVITNPYDF